MKNVICIDLTTFNNEKIVEVAKAYGFDEVSMINDKKKGFAKIYFDITLKKVIAFTTKKDKNVTYTKEYSEILKSLTPIVMVSEPKIMTVDGLLDKVSKYGVNSLSVSEKKFLDTNI